jgi:hypothetical protein
MPGQRVQVRHRPGLGLVVGLAGLLLTLLSFTALPWVSDGGQDVSLFDVRDQFEGMDPPSEVAYIVGYARWGWIAVFGLATVALVTSAALVPSSKTARIVISCFIFAVFGLFAIGIGVLANAWDDRGVVGPRIGAGFLLLVAIIAQIAAFADWFTGEMAPDPAFGAWAGFLGLAAVLTGCMMGTRTEPLSAWRPMPAPMSPPAPIRR